MTGKQLKLYPYVAFNLLTDTITTHAWYNITQAKGMDLNVLGGVSDLDTTLKANTNAMYDLFVDSLKEHFYNKFVTVDAITMVQTDSVFKRIRLYFTPAVYRILQKLYSLTQTFTLTDNESVTTEVEGVNNTITDDSTNKQADTPTSLVGDLTDSYTTFQSKFGNSRVGSEDRTKTITVLGDEFNKAEQKANYITELQDEWRIFFKTFEPMFCLAEPDDEEIFDEYADL